MNRLILTRRDRVSEGGAREQSRGLGNGEALVTGPAGETIPAGPVFLGTLLLSLAIWAFGISAARTDTTTVSVPPFDILWETEGENSAMVLRFVVPQIARDTGHFSYDDVSPAMDRLCDEIAIPVLRLTATDPTRILVILMDRPVERGSPTPDATQFINVYLVEDDRCIWENF